METRKGEIPSGTLSLASIYTHNYSNRLKFNIRWYNLEKKKMDSKSQFLIND